MKGKPEIFRHGNCSLSLSRRARNGIGRAVSLLGFVTLIIVTCPLSTKAQTEWKDRPVTHAVENQLAPSAARPAQSGFTIVVWEDQRTTSKGYDIYMQKIDTQTGLPLWLDSKGVPDGIAVCAIDGDQRNPRAAYDSLGGVIITWEDDRSGTTSVFAHRALVSTGELDTNWPTDGLAVCDLDSECEHVRIAGTADGAFITWLDYRHYQNGRNRAVYAQYILSATASWPQSANQSWAQDGIRVNDFLDDGDTENPEIDRDYTWKKDVNQITKAGCWIAYQNLIDFAGVQYWNIWAANLDANGLRRYNPSLIHNGTDHDQLYPRIVCAGKDETADQGRAIVVWQDAREDPNLPLYDIVAQVVDGDGGLQNQMGEIICDVPETQRYPVLTLWERPYDPTSGAPYVPFATFAWEDLREYAQTGVDIYAGKLDARFMGLVNPGGPAGDPITQVGSDQTQVAIDMVPEWPIAFIAWRHQNLVPYETDIHYQEVTLWPQPWQYGKPIDGWPVTAAKYDQQHPEVAGAVMVWEDHRRETIHNDPRYDWDIYCQTPGECVGPTAMNWRDMFADVHQEGDAAHLRFITDADFNTYVVWQKSTSDPEKQDVYVQKLDATGVPRWTNGGKKLNTVDYAQHPEVAISDVGGGAQVVWQQTVSGTVTEEMWYAKIDPEGEFDIDPEPIRDPLITQNVTHPMIVYSDYIVKPSGYAGEPPITSEYSAYFGYTVEDVLYIGVRESRQSDPEFWPVTSGGTWEHFEKLVSPPGQHLYAIGTGDDPTGGIQYCITAGRFSDVTPQKADWTTVPYPAVIDFGGIDIALDQLDVGNSQDAIVVVAQSNYPSWGAWLYAYWVNAANRVIGVGYSLVGTPVGTSSRFLHPRLAADDCRTANDYGGMLLVWDYEFPTASGQRHKVVTDKLTYATGLYPPQISRCDPNKPPIMVTSQQYSWPTNPDIARINAPNGVDTLAFVAWEGITEICAPVRPREIVGQWVAYNYFPGPQRGPQWPAEKQLSPGPGLYTQSSPLVQTSDANTIQVYWLDGRSGVDLVMGTRLWGAPYDVIEWAKDREQQAIALPDGHSLGETFPNPLSLQSGSVSHIVIEVEAEQIVDLTLHDMLGRVVGVLHQGLLPAGRHVLRFDPSGLHPGSYFYTLRALGQIATRGLVIVR